jgi:V/A-type H+/Na+-transporting ATPase subunit I
MFIKSDIRKVTIAVEKGVGQEVYTCIGIEGLIHLSRVQDADTLVDSEILAEEEKTRNIIADTSFILNSLKIDPVETSGFLKQREATKDALFVSEIKRVTERLLHLCEQIQAQQAVTSRHVEFGEALRQMGVDSSVVKKARFSRMVFGEIDDSVPTAPVDEPFILVNSGCYLFGAALPKDFPRMLQFLKGYGFIDKTGDVSGASLEILKSRLNSLNRRLNILYGYADRIKKETGPEMNQLYASYKRYEEILKVMRQAWFSKRAVFIKGWMDARDKGRLIDILKKICGERFIVSDVSDANAPVRLMNIGLFKPFELIVKMMGMPANSEIDPTPLAAITFVLVFGLMFGDLGQGLVLAMAGLVLKYISRKRNNEDLGHFGGILAACGLSAALCGILYGNFFSSEHLLPALWIRPIENIMGLFSATILLGVVFIMVGLFINIINALINADYAAALLEKRGAAILVIYASIVFFVVRYANFRQMPGMGEIGVFIIAPLLVFCARGMIGPLFFKIPKPQDLAEYVIETVIDIVEIVLSMFANTVSFVRVGAFALSHAGLSIVTYTLAGMVDPGLKSTWALIILVMGNIFIIGFEGMICGIQSMRLEYYEFFSKFYKGDGVVFSPFTLKAKMSEA